MEIVLRTVTVNNDEQISHQFIVIYSFEVAKFRGPLRPK